MMKISRALAALGLVCAVGGANASLVGRDINGNAVAGSDASSVFLYDTVLNVTWLRDANANGGMDWSGAKSWAANLTVGSYGGWRLPTMISTPNETFSFAGGTDFGYNVRTKSGDATQYEAGQTVYSEMSHLYYVTLGNLALCNPVGSTASSCLQDQSNFGLANTGDFVGLQAGYYWSDRQVAWIDTHAWIFSNASGKQYIQNQASNWLSALAVRDGDVLAAPIPAAAWLMLSGIGALGAAARRRKSVALQL
jgi:hypothetical protein